MKSKYLKQKEALQRREQDLILYSGYLEGHKPTTESAAQEDWQKNFPTLSWEAYLKLKAKRSKQDIQNLRAKGIEL